MFVTACLPLCDMRPLLQTATLERSPPWPEPVPGRHFVRMFGGVRDRVSGGVSAWTGEERFCDASKAVRLQPQLGHQFQSNGLPFRPARILRRLFVAGRPIERDPESDADGPLFARDPVVRFELGLIHGGTAPIEDLSSGELVRLVESVLNLKVSVRRERKRLTPAILGRSSQTLAASYLAATTLRKYRKEAESWQVEGQMPAVVVQYRRNPGGLCDEISNLPKGSVRIDVLQPVNSGVVLHQAHVLYHGSRIRVWLLGFDRRVNRDTVRQARVYLCRVHAEEQCLRAVIRHWSSHRFEHLAGTPAAHALQDYLRDALRMVDPASRGPGFGLDRRSLLGVMELSSVGAAPKDVEELRQNLSYMRGNLQRQVTAFAKRSTEGTLISHSALAQNVYYVEQMTQTQGGAMHSVEINFGDDTVISGNPVIAGIIRDSVVRIQESGASDELKSLLMALQKETASLAGQVPAEKGEQLAKDVEALSREATSPKPRRKWYELSAEGIKEAVKTVGDVATPILGIVTQLSKFFVA
jgi:hypothetical protein